MVSAKAWRENRLRQYTAPSGDTYKIEVPDPISLIQFWIKDCRITEPIGEKELGELVLKNPEVIKKMLIRYIKEPVITSDGSDDSLSVEELMRDQTDSLALLREILSFFLTRSDEVLNFFRSFPSSSDSR